MCTVLCAKVHSFLCKKGSLKKIFTTETLRTQRRIIFPLPLRGRQWKSTQQLTLHKLQKASILGCKVPRRAVYYPKGRVVLLFGVSAKSKKSKSSALSVSPAKRAVKKRCTQSRVMLVPDSFLWTTAMGVCRKFRRCSANPKKKQEKSLTIYIITNR